MRSRLNVIAGLLIAGLLTAACGSSSPTATPTPAAAPSEATATPTAAPAAPEATEAPTEAATTAVTETASITSAPEITAAEGVTSTEAITATENVTPAEGTALPSTTPATEAAATDEGRVAAPTFDPTVNQIALQPFLTGFTLPVVVTNAHDESGRIFVVEKTGTIKIVRDGVVVETPFLDITDRVMSSGNEQGLLGLAFPPNFSETGYFFVAYTKLNSNDAVARFQVDPATPDVADPASEFAVLEIEDPAPNHNGGNLVFGPDGYLWIGMGDGGGGGDTFGNGQNPATLLGKMLRLDVTSDPSAPYSIPPDNPWVNADWNGADVRDEVWSIGLRNPWRYSFDRHTGDLWIADVGQNQYEEVNYLVEGTQGGLNFGWPIMEGFHCFDDPNCDQTGLVLPIFEYEHAVGCSVTGGFVYRGSQYPMLQGVYLFGDYCSGIIWATIPNPDGSWKTTQMLDSDLTLSSFGEDENGELYVTDYGSGAVYQVTGQ